MKKIKKIKLLIWSILLFTQQMFAQEKDVKALIRDIKLNETYIYGEGTDIDKNIAYDIALQEITNNINELRLSSNKEPITTKTIVALLSQYSYNRGEAELVFVYIPISQIINLKPKENPKIDLHTDKKTTVTETKETQQDTSPAPSLNIASSTFDRRTSGQDMLTYILAPTQTTDLIKCLERFQSEGKISQIKNARSFDEIPTDAHVVAYNREHAVIAVFSPENNGERINYKNQQKEKITNYRGCGFFWFK